MRLGWMLNVLTVFVMLLIYVLFHLRWDLGGPEAGWSD